MSAPDELTEQARATQDSQAGTPQGAPRGVAAMSVVRWVIVIVTALVATGSIVSYARVRTGGAPSRSAGPIYYCPMHPSVAQDHPGECPICNMTLVPKPDAEPRGANANASPSPVPGLAAVTLSYDRIQLIGMKTAKVERAAVGGEIRTVGVVAASERGLAQINPRFGGWIEKLLVSQTGERVRRGQILATIYSPEVLRAEEELLVTRGWSVNGGPGGATTGSSGPGGVARAFDGDARRRLELLGISAPEIDEIARSGKAADAIAIRSPVDGYVVGKNAVAGVAVQPGTVLFEVADLSRVWVTADVYEQDIARVRVGQRARFELAAYPGERHVGRVAFIAPVLDAANRTLRVRLELGNTTDRNGPRLRPGMHGTVSLDPPPATGLAVPAEAVVDTGEAHYLFVSKPGGRFEPRRVDVGARFKDEIEILSGVAEGEVVVTTGNFLVDSESRLRAAIEGQTSPAR